MATGKSCSRWFAPVLALLMVVGLSGCFDKEGDQRKAFIDFLQNTAMRSGERLPTLTADQKKQFGPFVSDYAILYGYSQQVNQAMDSGLRPVVDSVNAIRVPQDYVTQREPLRRAWCAGRVRATVAECETAGGCCAWRAEAGRGSEAGL